MGFASLFAFTFRFPLPEQMDMPFVDGGQEIHGVIYQTEYFYAVGFNNFEFPILLRAYVHMSVPLLEWSFIVACCWAADTFLVFVAVAWNAVYFAWCDGFFFM